MYLKDQKGIGLLLEIIVVAVVVTVIGAIGFKVNHARMNANQNQVKSPTLSDKNYLTIKEWGVRMAADSENDFVIAGPPKNTAYSEKDETVGVKSTKLSKIWTCKGDDKGSIGSVTRTTDVKRAGSFQPAASKKIGQYTYDLDLIQNICSTDAKAEMAARDDLQSLFKTLESSAGQASDQTTSWKTYKSSNEPLSFKYPSDWKINITPPRQDFGGDVVDLTSPDGLRLRYYATADGLGGACEPPGCPDVQTYRVTPVNETNAPTQLYLVEGNIRINYQDSPDKGKYEPTMGLIGKTDITNIPRVGTESQTYPYFFIFPKRNNKTIGHVMFQFQAYPDQNSDLHKWHYTKAGLDEFFSRPDVQTARLIFQSLKY